MGIGLALDLLIEHQKAKIALIDVGARWGSNARWVQLEPIADILCFEPDAAECARLNASRATHVRYMPAALAEAEMARTLHVTAEPACSSLYPPIEALHEHFPPLAIIKPERRMSVPCRPLDDVLQQEGIGSVAAIKLDTQGSELEILRGATRALATCSLIDVEVEFNPLYEGQGLFCDVDRFLRDRGFVLWRLENLVHYAPEVVGAAASDFLIASEPAPSAWARVSNGQLFWAQAQYVRAEFPRTGLDRLSREAALPAALVAGAYGFWDLSLELLRKTDISLASELRARLSGSGG